MKTRKQRSAVRYSHWQEMYQRTRSEFMNINVKPKTEEEHPWLEWKTELSDKAEQVVIDHRFNEDGTPFGINQLNQARVIAIFKIDGREIYTSLRISTVMLANNPYLKNFIDQRMYEIACNIKKENQSS